jgi:hypothetical protein
MSITIIKTIFASIYCLIEHAIVQDKVKVKVTLVQALRLCTDRTAHRPIR